MFARNGTTLFVLAQTQTLDERCRKLYFYGPLGLDLELDEQDTATLYSRLSRAMLLIHNRCRHCEERADLACQAVTGWEEGPCPLLDVAANLVMTGSLAGCPKVEQGGGLSLSKGGGSNGG